RSRVRATGSPLGGALTCGFVWAGVWFAAGVLHVDAAGIHVRGASALFLPCYSCFWLLCYGRDNGLFSAVALPLIATSTNDLHVTDDILSAFRVRNEMICSRARWCLRRLEIKTSAADRAVLDAVSPRVPDR